MRRPVECAGWEMFKLLVLTLFLHPSILGLPLHQNCCHRWCNLELGFFAWLTDPYWVYQFRQGLAAKAGTVIRAVPNGQKKNRYNLMSLNTDRNGAPFVSIHFRHQNPLFLRAVPSEQNEMQFDGVRSNVLDFFNRISPLPLSSSFQTYFQQC